jgi:hypothetical protein
MGLPSFPTAKQKSKNRKSQEYKSSHKTYPRIQYKKMEKKEKPLLHPFLTGPEWS